MMMAGDLIPMPATMATNPSEAARLYAGAVEETPMTTLRAAHAPPLSPLSPG